MAVSLEKLQSDPYLGWVVRFKPNWSWLIDRLDFAVFTGMVVALGYYVLIWLLQTQPEGAKISDELAFALIFTMLPGFYMLERLTDWRLSVVVEMQIGVAVLIGAYIGVYQLPVFASIGWLWFFAKFFGAIVLSNAVLLGLGALITMALTKLVEAADRRTMQRLRERIEARGITYEAFTSMFEVTESPLQPRDRWSDEYYVVSDAQTGDWLRMAFTPTTAWLKAEKELISRVAPKEYLARMRRELVLGWGSVVVAISFCIGLAYLIVWAFERG